MAAVQAEVTVLTRAGDPTQHLLENDTPQVFQLTTTDSAYTTDTTAFAGTVYTYWNSQVGASNVAEVELRWKVWVGGGPLGGGTTTNDGVFNNQSPASGTDIQTELNAHIARALTGDQLTPGQ